MFQSKKSKALLTAVSDGDPFPAAILSSQEKILNAIGDSFIGKLIGFSIFFPAIILGSILYYIFNYSFSEILGVILTVSSAIFTIGIGLFALAFILGILAFLFTIIRATVVTLYRVYLGVRGLFIKN